MNHWEPNDARGRAAKATRVYTVRSTAPGQATVHFFLVGIGPGGANAMGLDRHVRKGAAPDEADPWVRVAGQPGRSREVHRFTEAGGKAWAAERLRLKGTRCRVVASRGPEL